MNPTDKARSALLPCPFCGSNEAPMTVEWLDGTSEGYIECQQCHASTGSHKLDGYKGWNTRAQAADGADDLKTVIQGLETLRMNIAAGATDTFLTTAVNTMLKFCHKAAALNAPKSVEG